MSAGALKGPAGVGGRGAWVQPGRGTGGRAKGPAGPSSLPPGGCSAQAPHTDQPGHPSPATCSQEALLRPPAHQLLGTQAPPSPPGLGGGQRGHPGPSSAAAQPLENKTLHPCREAFRQLFEAGRKPLETAVSPRADLSDGPAGFRASVVGMKGAGVASPGGGRQGDQTHSCDCFSGEAGVESCLRNVTG